MQLSLADFFTGSAPTALSPPDGFSQWRRDTAWAAAIYEPCLLGAPEPRVRVRMAGAERPVLNLTSYSYLGLGRHPHVLTAVQAAIAKYGTGACGSPILSGLTDLHYALEERLSRFFRREATMLFSSGFGGAMGCLAGLLRRRDAVFADTQSHASLIDGAQISRAKVHLFEHNDSAALAALLSRSSAARRVVVVEGIYSMDGDSPDLPAICDVAEAHGAGVVIDEAHSQLVCGEHGRGVAEQQECEARIGLYVGTFSKAFAAVGGFVSGPAETIDYLRCYARTFGFSCALPPATVAGLLAVLDVVEAEPEHRRRLVENAAWFRERARAIGIDIGAAQGHVVPIFVEPDITEFYRLAHALLNRGLFLAPIPYPAAAHDRLRFRASITAAQTREDLEEALAILDEVIVQRRGL